ncbi:ribonuclease HII, partial [Caulobacter sp. B11]
REGLRRLGPSPIHRLGWAPVKLALAARGEAG